ncbi:MAG TPA: FAD-binding protein, partial [Caldilineaceae bacterium]|nr:FAD-binding protein [Caldilineaceae bacterium]
MLDLLVIGAGMAGLSAALTAADAGLTVQLIAKGQSATHWHTGAVDLLGYLPGQEQPVSSPLSSLSALGADHPYRRLGAQRVAAAVASLQGWLAEEGIAYGGAGVDGENLCLPSPVGAARPTYLAPVGQQAGDLSRRDPLLIVGFTGLRDFFPELIAENLAKQGHAARAGFLPLTTITDRRDFTTVQLAAALDAPGASVRLAAALKPLVRPGERVGL